MVTPAPPVHLIIRLPYNRSEFPISDPPLVQWSADKENMLWEVIARSRAADSGGTDWPALSAHLQVPLPYLLYRAQVRYEEDLRGLQDVRSTLSVSSPGAARTDVARADERVSSGIGTARGTSRPASSSLRGRPPSSRPPSQSTPANKLLKDIDLSQKRNSTPTGAPRRVSTPPISEPSESDEDIEKEEEEARRQEEQEAVSRRLKELEKMMSSDLLGFASSPSRPRTGPSLNVVQPSSPLRETVRQGEGTSASESPVTSPQGSIPSIPSPPADSQSPTFSSQSSSQVATTLHPNVAPVSPQSRGWRQQSPRRGLAVKAIHSHRGSSQGSAASSFSDLSDAPSVSASALESALMSNIRGAGSRLSLFARSHLGGRGGGGH